MQTQKVIETLKGFDVSAIGAQLVESQIGTPEQAQETVAWIDRLRNELLQTASAVIDGEDLYMAVVANYIELKSRWIAINTQINYQTVLEGGPDPVSMQRGWSVSRLLNELEPLIEMADIEKVTEFLTSPISDQSRKNYTDAA